MVSEKEFHAYLTSYLSDAFGKENVESEYYLEDTGRFADFRVSVPFGPKRVTFFIEVENDWEAVLKGVGQTILYAAHEETSVPVIVLPEGKVEEPERTFLMACSPVLIIEIPYQI